MYDVDTSTTLHTNMIVTEICQLPSLSPSAWGYMFLFGSLGVRSHGMYKAGYRELLSRDDLVRGIIWVASKCSYN